MMNKRFLTGDDLAWVSSRINYRYERVKRSDVLTEKEKQIEINILMTRAMRFRLYETVERMGFIIFEIPFDGTKEPALLVLPNSYTDNDLDIVKKHLEFRLKP